MRTSCYTCIRRVVYTSTRRGTNTTPAKLTSFEFWNSCERSCYILIIQNIQGEHKKVSPTTFVDILAMCGVFCMKFYRTVKQSNVHFITMFGWNLLESDKLVLFQPRQPPFLVCELQQKCRLWTIEIAAHSTALLKHFCESQREDDTTTASVFEIAPPH